MCDPGNLPVYFIVQERLDRFRAMLVAIPVMPAISSAWAS